MHRSRLAERSARPTDRGRFVSPLVKRARAIQVAGIVRTYQLHDRALGNRDARRRFQRQAATLDDVQQRVLADLERQDFAVLPFAELVPDDALRQAVEEEGAAFISSTVASLRAAGDALRDLDKDYLVRRFTHGQEVSPDSPWLRFCLSDRMLALANAYLRMWSKLEYIDLWYTVPVQADSGRIKSQRWHRDFDDQYLLKVFLYLVDVDAETGPFEFVAGSARGGALANYYPWYPLSPAYPPEDEFERTVPAENLRTFTGSVGTLVLCNTSGFHRGGFATGKPRALATATYCSPASLAALTERNYRLPQAAAGSLSGPQRYAVT